MIQVRRDGRAAWALGLVMILPAAAAAQEPAGRPEPPAHRHDGTYMGRPIAEVMSYLGADWLLRPERELEEQPERMLAALKIEPGMTIADVGAGVGFHSLMMAKMVGADGKVYATDVQPEMLRLLRRRATAARVKNVVPVLATQEATGLPDGQIDLALMVDVYHEASEPDVLLEGLNKALKPGGRLVLVEFRAEDPDVPIKPEHKMTVEQVRREIEPKGFEFVELQDFLPWQHILIFRKAEAAAAPAVEGTPATPRS